MYTVAYVLMHTWPPKLLADLAEQLIAPAISQVPMDISQQLRSAHQRRDIHPMLLSVAGCWQKNLQLVVLRAVGLPQFDELVTLIWILWQHSCPQIVH